MSFIIQALFSGILALIILFVPGIYFSSTLNSDKNTNENNQNKILESNFNNVNSLSPQYRKSSVYKDSSIITIKENPSIFGNICKIIQQKVFIFSALALSNLFFIITAIQYWASDYEKNVLKISSENEIFLSFAIVCITSPTLGLFFGGIISAKTGGYESKNSIVICFVFALLAGISSIPVPFANDLYVFTFLLWLVLFFGGAILPNIMGIIMTCLPPQLRGSTNSILNLLTNLFGYLPAPIAYGFIYDRFKETNQRLAITIVIYSSFLGCLLILIAMYFKFSEPNVEPLINNYEISMRKTSRSSVNIASIYNPASVIISNEEFGGGGNYNYSDADDEYEDEQNKLKKNSKSYASIKGKKTIKSSDKSNSSKTLKKNMEKYKTNKTNKSSSKSPSRKNFTDNRASDNKSNLNRSLNASKFSNYNYDLSTKAVPGFNYDQYCKEHIFNKSNSLITNNLSEEDNKNLEILNDTRFDSEKILEFTKEIPNKNNYKSNGKNFNNNKNNNNNINQISLSIKTPDFNFVQSAGNHNHDFNSSNNSGSFEIVEPELVKKSEKFSKIKNNLKENNNNEHIQLEKIVESKDERKKLSYEENPYIYSEKSLFNPNFRNNNFRKTSYSSNELMNKDKIKADNRENEKDHIYNREKEKNSSESDKNGNLKSDKIEDYILSDNNELLESEQRDYNDEGPSSYRKFNDYV
jgi:hypothetical protein